MRAPQAANVSNPTVVEGLQGKYIVAIACGWHHTAGSPTRLQYLMHGLRA